MLALIAGYGALPRIVAKSQSKPPLICTLEGQDLDEIHADLTFRLERLGGFMRALKARGVTEICFCGGVARPNLSFRKLDLPTLALLPKILKGLRGGEDSALRLAISVFEDQGFSVRGAHDLVPNLLAGPGLLAGNVPLDVELTAALGDQISLEQSAADLGQSCVLRGDQVLAREGPDGTDAMLSKLQNAQGGVFYKACKPDQDRRVDMPVIGPSTVHGAAKAGLFGLIIEAENVMLLERAALFQALEETGLFLLSRRKGAAIPSEKGV